MSLDNCLSYDNRESCVKQTPSSCVKFTGILSPEIKKQLPCDANINDVIKELDLLINNIKTSLGDNKTLDKNCFTFDKLTVKQSELNQLFIDQLCTIKTQLSNLDLTVNPGTLQLAVNLLCLADPSCSPQQTYSLETILTKLITAYCSLLTRVKTIEDFLNL